MYEILPHDYRHRMLNLIIRTLQNTPPTGYESSTIEKGTVCVCIWYTCHWLKWSFSPLEQDKEEIIHRWGSIFICICHKPQVASCFPVCQRIYMLKEGSLSLKVPQRAQLTTATAKIFIAKTAWCLPHLMSYDLWFAKLEKASLSYPTLQTNSCPDFFFFFFRRKIASISITISFSKHS